MRLWGKFRQIYTTKTTRTHKEVQQGHWILDKWKKIEKSIVFLHASNKHMNAQFKKKYHLQLLKKQREKHM